MTPSNQWLNVVGGWYHKGKVYFDAVMLIESKDEAIKLGKENNQIGIYNIGLNEYLSL